MTELKLPPKGEIAAFLLAFIAGAAAAGAVYYLGVIGMLGTPGAMNVGYLLTVMSPLAGLSVFQLLFGMTGRWRGWRFWAVALPVVYLIILGLFVLALQGMLQMTVALPVAAVLLLLAGIWGLSLTQPQD